MNILGLDYGEKHVGVALAEGPLAAPLTTLNNQTAIFEIKKIIKDLKIEKIIVGDCSEEFSKKLKDLGVIVIQTDETLSSHDARTSLLHTTQRRRKNKEHAAAAALILQSWIDSCKV